MNPPVYCENTKCEEQCESKGARKWAKLIGERVSCYWPRNTYGGRNTRVQRGWKRNGADELAPGFQITNRVSTERTNTWLTDWIRCSDSVRSCLQLIGGLDISIIRLDSKLFALVVTRFFSSAGSCYGVVSCGSHSIVIYFIIILHRWLGLKNIMFPLGDSRGLLLLDEWGGMGNWINWQRHVGLSRNQDRHQGCIHQYLPCSYLGVYIPSWSKLRQSCTSDTR